MSAEANSSAPSSSSSPAAAPASMRALVLKAYSPAKASQAAGKWVVENFATPSLAGRPAGDVLIRVHAASINPIDWKIAEGQLKVLHSETFPILLGFDCSGTVVAVNGGVSGLKVGDEVISRVAHDQRGTFAEYVISSESHTVRKPREFTHESASCLPLAGMTALQVLERFRLPERPKPRSVFIPAALGGVGVMGIQLAKHVFGVERIATAVSTGKLEQTREFFAKQLGPGADGKEPLEIVDYKKSNPAEVLKNQMDAVFDTTGECAEYFPMMKNTAAKGSVEASVAISIATTPSGDSANQLAGPTGAPWLIRKFLDIKDWNMRRKLNCGNPGGEYSHYVLSGNAKDLQKLVDEAEAGRLEPIVGKVFPLDQAVDALEAASNSSVTGKVVIQMIKPPQ